MDTGRATFLKKLSRKKVMTIPDVAKFLQRAVISARRRLKEWQALTSCNRNGIFYTLPEIAEFDKNGLWRYQGILFSQHGNFKETIQHLVDKSNAGLNGQDVTALTGLKPNNPIFYDLRDKHLIEIQKHDGQVVFFSAQKEVLLKQSGERSRLKPADLPRCEDCVMILVEMIRAPGIEIHDIALRLKQRGIKIAQDSIRALLAKHDLLKKTRDIY